MSISERSSHNIIKDDTFDSLVLDFKGWFVQTSRLSRIENIEQEQMLVDQIKKAHAVKKQLQPDEPIPSEKQVILDQGNQASETIIRSYALLIIKLANSFDLPYHEANELIQAGCIAIEKALPKFSYSKGNKLVTFVFKVMKNGMIAEMRKNKRRESRELLIMNRPISEDSEAGDMMKAEDDDQSNYEDVDLINLRKLVETICNEEDEKKSGGLSLQEKTILIHSFGLNDQSPKSLRNIAPIANVSHSRVDQLKKQALELLKNQLKLDQF